jgi:hypothetical protein
MPLSQILKVTATVCSKLDALNVIHVVGGSVASSAHGVPRSTNDIDLVAALSLEEVDDFVNSVARDFYVDEEAVRDAIRSRESFNLIHLASMFKVDVFVPADDPISQSQLKRRVQLNLAGSRGMTLPVLSAEDVILQKLRWYELGNRTSERQWSDVVGVLKTQSTALDISFVREMATMADLGGLLDLAIAQAGGEMDAK